MSYSEKPESESLEDVLRQELGKSEPDRDTVIRLLKEIKRREPESEEPDLLLESCGKQPQNERAENRSSGWWKRVAVAAAVCLVLLACVPNVFGSESVFSMIGRWTKEIFSFGDPKEKVFVYQTEHPGLQELYDTVTALGVERNVVPTWIPDGYVLDQSHTQKTPNGVMVFSGFSKGDDYIGIKIQIYKKATEYQKGAEDAILYERAGIKHYIMVNDEKWTAAWALENAECAISTFDKGSLYKMLDSIYTLEGQS